MPLTPNQIAHVVAHVNQRWRTPGCLLCGSNNWSVYGPVHMVLAPEPLSPTGALNMPCVAVLCGTCGQTVLVNWVIAGSRMSDPTPPHAGIQLNPPPQPPVIELRRIERIPTYEVMETDLENLDQLVASESQALGFATFFTGVTVTLFATLLATPGMSYYAKVTFALFGAVAFVGAMWFGLTWWRTHRQRPRLLEKIRSGAKQLAPSTPSP